MSNTEQDAEATVEEINPTWIYKGVELPDKYYAQGFRFRVRFAGHALHFFRTRDGADTFVAQARDE